MTRRRRRDHLLEADEVATLYNRIAPGYDAVLSVAGLLGARRLANRAVRLLGLRPGDTVVDLGCGTGANLDNLAAAVGPTGHVIGVDLSGRMLDRARRRQRARVGGPVELVRADIREYDLPSDTRAVLSTFALEMVPEYDQVIAQTCDRLAGNGGRLAVSGLRRPPHWPEWAVNLGIFLTRPFGVSRAYTDMRPWEAVRRHAHEMAFQTSLLGAIYLSVGAPDPDAHRISLRPDRPSPDTTPS